MVRSILNIFDHGILESVLLYAVYVLGRQPNSWEKREMRKMRSVLSRGDHPLHSIFTMSGRSKRLLLPRCSTERFRMSFVPTAIRLFNKSCIWCGDLFCWYCCDYCVLSVYLVHTYLFVAVVYVVPCLGVFTVLLMYVVVCCWWQNNFPLGDY